MKIILLIIIAICARGWFLQRISTMSLLWYMQEKNCPLPSENELEKSSRAVVQHMVKDFFGNVR